MPSGQRSTTHNIINRATKQYDYKTREDSKSGFQKWNPHMEFVIASLDIILPMVEIIPTKTKTRLKKTTTIAQ